MARFPHLGPAAVAYVKRLQQAKAERDAAAAPPVVILRAPEEVTSGETEQAPEPPAASR